jgi:hypothetical protein
VSPQFITIIKQCVATSITALPRKLAKYTLQLTEQTQFSTQMQYDRAGNVIGDADAEIARMRAILKQLDDLETEFDKVTRIRDVVKSLRSRVEDLDKRVSKSGPKNRSKPRTQQQQPASHPQKVFQTQSSDRRVHKPLALNAKDSAALVPDTVSKKPGGGHDSSQSSTSVRKQGLFTGSTRSQAIPGSQSSFRGIDHGEYDSNTFVTTRDGSSTSSMSTEDSNDTGSDSSEDWCSPIEWQHHLILEAVMTEFYAMFHEGGIPGAVNSAYGQSGSSNSAKSSSSTTKSSFANQSSVSSANNSSGSKRPNQDGSFPPPDEDPDGNKRPRILSTDSKSHDDKRRLACPFFKHDPCRHGQRGSCTGPGFKSISHLK